MQTIAAISQKGGSGKTTLAVNLAVAADLAGRAAIVLDLDSQRSATVWGKIRLASTPVVAPARPGQLGELLDRARESGAELAVIDTSPHAETPALEAARAADLVLIPCRPSIFDLRAVETSFRLAELAGTYATGLLWAVPSRSSLGDQAIEALKRRGVQMIGDIVGQRTAYAHAATAGLGVQEFAPRSLAAREIAGLYRTLDRALSTKRQERTT